jgi:hypothetical protein
MLVGGTDEGEAVDYLVRHELGVRASDFCVMEIVIPFTVSDICGQLFGQLFGVITRDEIDDVV